MRRDARDRAPDAEEREFKMDRRPVQKIEVKMTILMRADSPEAAQAEIEALEAVEVAEMITSDDAVGSLTVVSAETVARDEVEAELQEVGNDGTFFEIGDEDDVDDAEDGDAR
jgi:hypothetical protein